MGRDSRSAQEGLKPHIEYRDERGTESIAHASNQAMLATGLSSPAIEYIPLADIPGISTSKGTVSVNLQTALQYLIADSQHGYADTAIGGTKALERGLPFLTESLHNRLLNAVSDRDIPLYLKEEVATVLKSALLPQDAIDAFFYQIEKRPQQSIPLFHEHYRKVAIRYDGDVSQTTEDLPHLTGGKVISDATLVDRLINEHLLKSEVAGLLRQNDPNSILYFGAKDGQTILPLVGACSRATLLETDPGHFASLEQNIKKLGGVGDSASIDFAQRGLDQAVSYLGQRRQFYNLVLLPALSHWGNDDLLPVLMNTVKELVTPGGVLTLPYGAIEQGVEDLETPELKQMRLYLPTGHFQEEKVERQLTFIAANDSNQDVRDAFVDLIYYARSLQKRITRESIEHELGSYLLPDGSYRFTLRLPLIHFTKQGELSSHVLSDTWPTGNFTGVIQRDTKGVYDVAVGSSSVIDGGISYKRVINASSDSHLELPGGVNFVIPKWPNHNELPMDSLRNVFYDNHRFDLIHTEPEIRAVPKLRAPEKWEELYRVQRELWLTLLSSWPVQQQLLQLIADESPRPPANDYHQRRTGLELWWFGAAQQHLWPHIKSQAKELLDNTERLITLVSNSKDPEGRVSQSLAVQLNMTREYLSRIDVHYDYRNGEYLRIMDLPPDSLTDQSMFKERISALHTQMDQVEEEIARANHELVYWVIKHEPKYGGSEKRQGGGEVLGGYKGLKRAIGIFNFKNQFSTYACHWIRQGIVRMRSNEQPLSEADRYFFELKRSITQKLGHRPTEDEIVDELTSSRGMTRERAEVFVRRRSMSARLRGTPRSLNTPLGDSDGVSLIDLLSNGISTQQDSRAPERIKSLLSEVWQALPKESRDVLSYRYISGRTLEDVASLKGITRERVRQIECEALDTVFVDSNPAYRELTRYLKSGEFIEPHGRKGFSYLSDVVEHPLLSPRLLRHGIFTVEQLVRYSARELELPQQLQNELINLLAIKGRKLADKVIPYRRDQISPRSLSWLPAPARAKILMGMLADEHAGTVDLEPLWKHWSSVLPEPQRMLVTRYLPTSCVEGLCDGREIIGKKVQERPQLVQALTALGDSGCPTALPVYQWIMTGQVPELKPCTHLISDVLKDAPEIALELVSRGVFTIEQLKQMPEHRLSIIKEIKRTQRERIKAVAAEH